MQSADAEFGLSEVGSGKKGASKMARCAPSYLARDRDTGTDYTSRLDHQVTTQHTFLSFIVCPTRCRTLMKRVSSLPVFCPYQHHDYFAYRYRR